MGDPVVSDLSSQGTKETLAMSFVVLPCFIIVVCIGACHNLILEKTAFAMERAMSTISPIRRTIVPTVYEIAFIVSQQK